MSQFCMASVTYGLLTAILEIIRMSFFNKGMLLKFEKVGCMLSSDSKAKGLVCVHVCVHVCMCVCTCVCPL